MKRSTLFFAYLFAATLAMIWMSLQYFDNETSGIVEGKEAASYLLYRVLLLAHISMGMVAIATGPFQLMKKLRRSPVHKILGYIYAASILVSGLAGLAIARFAMGGFISATGFTILSLVWITTTILGVYYIVSDDPVRHRRWMLRSIACTFATITQRTLLLTAVLDNVDFMTVYQLSAWFPWLFNLLVVEVWTRSRLDPAGTFASY